MTETLSKIIVLTNTDIFITFKVSDLKEGFFSVSVLQTFYIFFILLHGT